MGRFDRMKVYNGGWKSVYRVQVYNGSSWVDLGTNESDNTRKGAVYTSGSSRTFFTNHKVTTTTPAVPGDGASGGQFQLKPLDVWTTYGISARGGKFYISGTIRRTNSSDANIFYLTGGGNVYCQITWLANGRIQVNCYNPSTGAATSALSSNAVTAVNTWVNLYITMEDTNLGNNKHGSITWNGVYTTISVVRTCFSNTTNRFGDSNLQWTGTFACHGAGRSGVTSSNKTVTLNMSDVYINSDLTHHTALPKTPTAGTAGSTVVNWVRDS